MGIAAGWQNYIFFGVEETWGTNVAAAVYCPIEGGYNVSATPEMYRANMHCGVRQRRQSNQVARRLIQGTIGGDLLGRITSSKSVMQYLIEWAYSSPSGLDLTSWTIESYDPNDQKRHVGARCNSLTISGSEGQPIKFSAELIAKAETGGITAPTITQTVVHGRSAMFPDATFALGGSAASLRSFSLVINNNLSFAYNNGYDIATLIAGQREISYEFTLNKTANTYDALRRSAATNNITAQLVIKADHQGTGANTYATATADIDVMSFAAATDQMGLSEIWQQTGNYVIVKPDTTDNDVDWTFGTV